MISEWKSAKIDQFEDREIQSILLVLSMSIFHDEIAHQAEDEG